MQGYQMQQIKLAITLLIKSMNWHHTWPNITKTHLKYTNYHQRWHIKKKILYLWPSLIWHLIDCIQDLNHDINIDLLADGDCFRFAGPMERCQAEVELQDRGNSTYLIRHRGKECTEYALSIKWVMGGLVFPFISFLLRNPHNFSFSAA